MRKAGKGGRAVAGFTLLEMMTVVAVIAVLSGIAMISFNTGLDRIRANSGVRTISYTLNYARIRAIAENRSYVVRFVVKGGVNSNEYTCMLETFCDANRNLILDPGETIRKEVLPKGIVYDLSTVKDINDQLPSDSEHRDGIDFPDNQVIFSPRGYASTRGEIYIIPSGNLEDAYNGNRKAVSVEAISGKTVIWNYHEALEENGVCPWKEDGK
jgi:prepilin-type N-terminal cleavage/methylation domain-containing protein